MPWVPVPSSKQPPKAKGGVTRILLLAFLALVFLLALWQIGKELYTRAKTPAAPVIDTKR